MSINRNPKSFVVNAIGRALVEIICEKHSVMDVRVVRAFVVNAR
jgi:hypothetical protein